MGSVNSPQEDSDRQVNSAHSGASRRTVLKAAGAATAGLTGLAGCISGSGQGGVGTVKYGMLNPMTGPYGGLAKGQRNGLKLAVKHINDSDDYDFEIEASYEDTEAKSSVGRRKAQKLVEQKDAQFLMGAISSSTALALNDFAKEEEVIYNPGGAAIPITGKKCNEYVFRAETNTGQIAEAAAPWTINNLGTKVWFHVADYAYGNSVLREWRSRMKKANSNFEEVGVSKAKLGASNFGSYISQIANSDAEIVVLGMTGGDLIKFTKQAANKGLKDQVNIVGPTMTFQVVRGALGKAAAGTYGGVRYVPKVETGDNQSFVSAYEDEYGKVPDTFARVAYDSIRMTAQGIQEAGSNDPKEVKDTLAGLEVDSLYGKNKFRECDHQAMNTVWVGENVMPDSGETTSVKLHKKVEGKDAIPSCDSVNCSL